MILFVESIDYRVHLENNLVYYVGRNWYFEAVDKFVNHYLYVESMLLEAYGPTVLMLLYRSSCVSTGSDIIYVPAVILFMYRYRWW